MDKSHIVLLLFVLYHYLISDHLVLGVREYMSDDQIRQEFEKFKSQGKMRKENANIDEFRELLERSEMIYKQDFFYSLPEGTASISEELRNAVFNNDQKLAKKLLRANKISDVDQVYSLARLAIIKTHFDMADLIIKESLGVEPVFHKKFEDEKLNFYLSIRKGLEVQRILDLYTPINTNMDVANNKNELPVHIAAKGGLWFHLDVQLERLMQCENPYRNIIDADGLSVLQMLSAGMNSSFVKRFLENSSDEININYAIPSNGKFKPGYTALHFAAERCRFDTMKTLLEHGADPNIKDASGQTFEDIFCKILWDGDYEKNKTEIIQLTKKIKHQEL